MTSLISPQRISRQRGSTLIELLVVIAIISVLIGLSILAGLQKIRIATNLNIAQSNLLALAAAARSFQETNGAPPGTLSDLAAFCAAHTDVCSGLSNFRFGPTQGYLFFVSNNTVWQASAEPAFPGITGSVSLVVDEAGNLTTSPTSGSDHARAQMFDNIARQRCRRARDSWRTRRCQ